MGNGNDLNEICYMFENVTDVCCDSTQLAILKNRSTEMKLIGAAECASSLQSMACLMSCSPSQSRFLYASQGETENGSVYIDKVTLFITLRALNYLYEKCKDAEIYSCFNLVEVICGDDYENECKEDINNPDIAHHTRNYLLHTLNFVGKKYDVIVGTSNSTFYVNGKCLHPFSFHTALMKDEELKVDQLCANKSTLTSGKFLRRMQTIEDIELTTAALSPRSRYKFWIIFSASAVVVIAMFLTVILLGHKLKSEHTCRIEQKSLCTEISYSVEEMAQNLFYRIGKLCSDYPLSTIMLCLICCGLLSLGIIKFNITNDPVTLWSIPNGRYIQEKEYFESKFGPFHRITQLFLIPKDADVESSSNMIPKDEEDFCELDVTGNVSKIFSMKNIMEVEEIHKKISMFKGHCSLSGGNTSVSINDVCYKPLDPINDNCSMMSVHQWMPEEKDCSRLIACSKNPMKTICRANYGLPMFSHYVLAGRTNKSYSTATAFSIVIVLKNSKNSTVLAKTLAWEKSFLTNIKNFSSKNFKISYLSERSIQDEIEQDSKTDVSTVALSYAVMFVYISLCIGSFRSVSTIFVDVKCTIGLTVVITVLLSAVVSASIVSFCKYQTTLLILQVVPFLLVAVGSGDNFIFVKSYLRICNDEKYPVKEVKEKVSLNLKNVGPSLFLSSVCQAVAFSFGMLVPVYAVRLFAFYSAIAVIIKFVLQVTIFVAVFTLDAKRQEEFRLDFFYCVKATPTNKNFNVTGFVKVFSKLITKKCVSQGILFIFSAACLASVYFCSLISIGFDQKVVLRDESYVNEFLNIYEQMGEAGAPVFFVLKGNFDYLKPICSNSINGDMTSGRFSLVSKIKEMAANKNVTYLTGPILWWLPEFKRWTNEMNCCSIHKNSTRMCEKSELSKGGECHACSEKLNKDNLSSFVKMFLNNSRLGGGCGLTTNMIYKDSVSFDETKSKIEASYLMAFHTVLRSSHEYITAMKIAQEIAANVSKILISNGCFEDKSNQDPVFAYSPFYVFYEQYLYTATYTAVAISCAIVGIFIATFASLGFDFHSAFIVLMTLTSSLLNLFGVMGIFNIELNSVSVVNIVMAVGIMVEFYVHIARDFATSEHKTYRERIHHCMKHTGTDVLIGVTIPELLSITTMAFAESKLFRIYFFKMYFAIIAISTINALILLPALLYLCGPPSRVGTTKATEKYCSTAGRRTNIATNIYHGPREGQKGGRYS